MYIPEELFYIPVIFFVFVGIPALYALRREHWEDWYKAIVQSGREYEFKDFWKKNYPDRIREYAVKKYLNPRRKEKILAELKQKIEQEEEKQRKEWDEFQEWKIKKRD